MKTDSIWLEERNYLFDCLVQYLRDSLNSESDSLALLVMGCLFYQLEDLATQNRISLILGQIIEELPPINDSGLQHRDCLIVIGYCFCINRIPDMQVYPNLINPTSYIQYAQNQDWFDNPRLAVLSKLLAIDSISSYSANNFLEQNLSKWISENYLPGIFCYCLSQKISHDDIVIHYLTNIDWLIDSIEMLSLGLLTISKLISEGHNLTKIRNLLAKSIIVKLRDKNIWSQTLIIEDMQGYEYTDSYTLFDLASATFALKIAGFDKFYGVLLNEKNHLDKLAIFYKNINKSGVIISRIWFLIFQISLIINSLLLVKFLVNKLGMDALFAVFLDILVPALLVVIGSLLFRKGRPAVSLMSEIIGEVSLSPQNLETTDDSNKPTRSSQPE